MLLFIVGLVWLTYEFSSPFEQLQVNDCRSDLVHYVCYEVEFVAHAARVL